MPTWVALFRGINVGGNHPLRMADLKSILKSLNCADVRSYIQSGNVVFTSRVRSAPRLAKQIADAIDQQHGFAPAVLLLTPEAFRNAVANNPFPVAADAAKTVHLGFLETPAESPNWEAIEQAQSPTEKLEIQSQVAYLLAPDGIGRSKLAANLERHLGVATTSRNLRTAQAILKMLDRDVA